MPLQPDDPKQSPTPAPTDATAVEPLRADLQTPENVRSAGEANTALVEAVAGDPWLGRVLDERYRITERLGEGGMGAVFVAEHLKLRKSVALKVIRAELAGNGEVAARFAREAMATAQFEHPHVAAAIDFGTLAEGGAYLVMQLVRGQSMRDLLDQRGKLPWPLACELLAQVADALSAARLAGIVHRDLKPENILVEVREDGSYLAKILDFGIAHVAPQRATPTEPDAEARVLTRIGTVMGTPGYMSPEQAVGDRVDHRTDLYALGVVLWECVVGRGLWDGPDVTSIITKQLRDEVPRLRTLLPDAGLPRELDDLVQQLCAREANNRPEHAGLVRDALRALANQRAAPARVFVQQAADYWAWARGRFIRMSLASRALVVASAAASALAVLALAVGQRSAQQATPTRATSSANPESVPIAPIAKLNPSLADRAIEFAQRVVSHKPEPDKTDATGGVPSALVADVQVMLESSRSQDRRRAAGKILSYRPLTDVYPYLIGIARLEQARTCRERKDAVNDIAELKDPRCLPALHRLADAGRTGCGFLGLRDCYGCVRTELRRALEMLEPSSE